MVIRRMMVVAAATVVACVLVATPAAATPPSGLSARIVAQATIGHTDYVLRQITLAPGGTTGWHVHSGPVRAVVRSGVLTTLESDCHSRTYHLGEIVAERANDVHLGRNDGATPTVLMVVYVKPTGTPLATSTSAPPCAH